MTAHESLVEQDGALDFFRFHDLAGLFGNLEAADERQEIGTILDTRQKYTARLPA